MKHCTRDFILWNSTENISNCSVQVRMHLNSWIPLFRVQLQHRAHEQKREKQTQNQDGGVTPWNHAQKGILTLNFGQKKSISNISWQKSVTCKKGKSFFLCHVKKSWMRRWTFWNNRTWKLHKLRTSSSTLRQDTLATLHQTVCVKPTSSLLCIKSKPPVSNLHLAPAPVWSPHLAQPVNSASAPYCVKLGEGGASVTPKRTGTNEGSAPLWHCLVHRTTRALISPS